MEQDLWKLKKEIILLERKAQYNDKVSFQYYHYTSLKVLFDILDGDSFWVSNIRFSNDAMEERLLQEYDSYYRDDYVLCFCQDNNLLSQWRGYCFNGGASIKLDIKNIQEYSILHSDYDKTNNYEVMRNVPLPVIYVDDFPQSLMHDLSIRMATYNNKITIRDIIPYLKINHFSEEKESRMIFSNINGRLSKCIRFRTLNNGVKTPYIVVKSGNIGKMHGTCRTDVNAFKNDSYIKKIVDNGENIWIEEGTNQEKVYYEVMKCINEYKKNNHIDEKIKVYCKGHLPIDKITVAPSYDIDRVAEQIERFCKSKYWLSDVDIEKSDIPYIRPSL